MIESVCEIFRKVVGQHKGIPITFVLDNARYQKCKLVLEFVKSLGESFDVEIELLYLPPYSPTLNLIKRLWKFVKKKCL